MLGSAPELGLEHLGSAEGILEVDPGGREPGSPVAPALALDDTIFVLEIPSNRPDCESHLGIARELQQLAGTRVQPPPTAAAALAETRRAGAPAGAAGVAAGGRAVTGSTRKTSGGFTVSLLDDVGCPLYTGRVIRGVRVAPSPFAVRQRLFTLGVRPLDNVVDATNYVLLELGTPLHVFDLQRLAGNEIRVRRAGPGERLVTLDGRERTLDPEMTVIADGERAVGVGGVMGGQNSEISAATRDLFLEAAFFDPERIRHTASRLGLRTEASTRFGRGVDPGVVVAGRERAVELITAWAGGAPDPEGLEVGARGRPPTTLELRPERVAAATGMPLSRVQVREALEGEDLEVEDAGRALRVVLPGHRFDLVREIDLVEEVARRIGYDTVPATPLPPTPGVARIGEDDALARLRETLRGLGLDEAYTSTFFDPAPFGPGFYDGRLLEQANPLAQNEPYLRPTLAATLVEAARHNLRRGVAGAAFFEIGHVFARDLAPAAGAASASEDAPADLPRLPGVDERRRLGLLLAGQPRPPHWSRGGKEAPADFYDLKGVIEALVGSRRDLSAASSERAWLHPGQQAELRLDGRLLGFLGRLHPQVERALDLDVQAFVADLDLAPFLEGPAPARFEPVSPFPRIARDLALVVPDAVAAADVDRIVREAGLANLVEVHLFDLYRGEPVPAGARSLAFRLVFQNAERTLTEPDVEHEIEGLLAVLARAGIRQR
jgi:phenylalanyl-tRNA synthetase beta chain